MRSALLSLATGLLIAAPLGAAPVGTALLGAEPPPWQRALIVTDETLLRALDVLAGRSPTFRAALDSVAARGGHILVLSLEQVTGADEQFAREGIAETRAVVQPDSSVATVMIVLNLEQLREVYRAARVPTRDFERDLQRILAHEVFGHAVPYLVAGHARAGCADPQEGETYSCSIHRENRVRREAGLGTREGYDLSGLTLSRYLERVR